MIGPVELLFLAALALSSQCGGTAQRATVPLCPSLRRVCRLVIEGTRVEPDLFVGYATIKVRNLLGELEDFLDAHRPQEREGPAHPPPVTGGKAGGRPGGGAALPGGEGSREEKPAEASKEKASESAHREQAKEPRASTTHPARPVFQGDRGRSARPSERKADREKETGTPAAEERSAPRDRDRRESPKPEVEVKREEEAADYSLDDKKDEDPGVREVVSTSRSREVPEEVKEDNPTPKKRRHRHRSRSRRRRERNQKGQRQVHRKQRPAGPSCG